MGRRHRRCMTCMAAYGREHYARNRLLYINRNVVNTRKRRRDLNERVWEYLVGHPCVDCGEPDVVVLEFDHVDRSTKRSDVYGLVHRAYSWGVIVAEIEKCE